MELKNISVKKLKFASFNPVSRTETKKLLPLKRSIVKYGILEPITVTQDMKIVNGHRRVACAKSLKMKEVPAIIHNGKTAEMHPQYFSTINTVTRKFSGGEMLQAWLKGGNDCCSPNVLNSIQALLGLMGRNYLIKISKSGVNPYLLLCDVNTVAKHTGWGNDKRKKILKYALTNSTWALRRACRDNSSPSVIRKAINTNKPLKRTWS